MPINSREKGARGERELKALLNEYGFNVHRGFSYRGEPDLIGLDGIHIEVKVRERLNIWEAMRQATEDSEKMQDGFPTVFHKRSRTGWLVTLKLKDFADLYKAWKHSRNGE